jgi:hypothetical protein
MDNPADEYVARFVSDERALLSNKKRPPIYISMKTRKARIKKQAKGTAASPSAQLAAAGRR